MAYLIILENVQCYSLDAGYIHAAKVQAIRLLLCDVGRVRGRVKISFELGACGAGNDFVYF